MKRKSIREKDGKFCRLEIEYMDGRLSICGTAGRIVSRKRAKDEALEYWISFFEDSPAEIIYMNRKFEKRFTSARSAAKFVLEQDGEFHGLDVVKEDGNRVYLFESGGQIVEELSKWFPEIVPYLKYHLNDIHPDCEHQEAEGWKDRPIDPSKPNTYGKHFPGQKNDSWNRLTWVSRDEHPEGLMGFPCPTCGYKYGTKWLKREVPTSAIKALFKIE